MHKRLLFVPFDPLVPYARVLQRESRVAVQWPAHARNYVPAVDSHFQASKRVSPICGIVIIINRCCWTLSSASVTLACEISLGFIITYIQVRLSSLDRELLNQDSFFPKDLHYVGLQSYKSLKKTPRANHNTLHCPLLLLLP